LLLEILSAASAHSILGMAETAAAVAGGGKEAEITEVSFHPCRRFIMGNYKKRRLL